MAPNATLETLPLNPHMNDNNQDPDLNFLHESVSSLKLFLCLISKHSHSKQKDSLE